MNIRGIWRCIVVMSFASVLIALALLFSESAHHNDGGKSSQQQSYKQRDLHSSVMTSSLSYASLASSSSSSSAAAASSSSTTIKSMYFNNRTQSNVEPAWNLTAVQENRQRHMAQVCHRMSPRQWTAAELREIAGQADTLFVDDKLQYLYCLVPKVACTTWTRVLLVASGKTEYERPNDIPQNIVNFYRYKGRILRPLARYKPHEIEYRLKNYFKFIFVRHPFERLVSAYRDRVRGDHAGPRQMISREIWMRLEQDVKAIGRRKKMKGASFEEFVHYVVDPKSDRREANQHWRPMYDLCHPCNIHYDFIGHYETIGQDAEFVLNKLGLSSRIQFPYSDPNNQRKFKTAALLGEMFSKVPPDDVEKLKKLVYPEDFELFEYK